MTKEEQKTVEQMVRIREARFMLRSVADDAGLSITPELEAELRTTSRRLETIEMNLSEGLTIRKARSKGE